MSAPRRVEVPLELDDGRDAIATCEVSEYVPARGPTMHGPGEPAEGGDVDILTLRLDARDGAELSLDLLTEYDVAIIEERALEEADEQEHDDAAEAAEQRWERETDR